MQVFNATFFWKEVLLFPSSSFDTAPLKTQVAWLKKSCLRANSVTFSKHIQIKINMWLHLDYRSVLGLINGKLNCVFATFKMYLKSSNETPVSTGFTRTGATQHLGGGLSSRHLRWEARFWGQKNDGAEASARGAGAASDSPPRKPYLLQALRTIL